MRHLVYNITVQDLKGLTDPKSIRRLNEYWDPRDGDQFIIEGSDEVRILTGDNNDEEGLDLEGFHVSYATDKGKEWVSFDKCLPILSIQQMIEIIDIFEFTQIQRLTAERGFNKQRWMVIVGMAMFLGEAEEQLVSVLWKAMKHYLSEER